MTQYDLVAAFPIVAGSHSILHRYLKSPPSYFLIVGRSAVRLRSASWRAMLISGLVSPAPSGTPPVSTSPGQLPPQSNQADVARHQRHQSRSPHRANDGTRRLSLRHTDGVNRWGRRRTGSPVDTSRQAAVHTQEAHFRTESPRDSLPDPRTEHSGHSPEPGHRKDVHKDTLPANEDRDISLSELAHIVRLSKYQERKCANTRLRVHRSQVAAALNARLVRCGDIAYRSLVENFRKDDKDAFTVLFAAVQDVRRSCYEMQKYAMAEPESAVAITEVSPFGSSESLNGPPSPSSDTVPAASATPFLEVMSTISRETLLNFITDLRTNPDYLATRICALSSSELNSLVVFHKGSEQAESVLPYQGRSPSRLHASASSRSRATSNVERLLSFHRHDPLSILVHCCFANSTGPDCSEDQRRTDIWASVLAKIIQQPKSTSEPFLISVFNVWTVMCDWSGKARMEWYLMKILQGGAFILDRAEDQHGTRFNLSDWNSSDEAAAKEFYDNSVSELFCILDNDDGTGIPEGLLELGNAVLAKLEPKYRENTSRWLVWRGLFSVFLLGVVIHPESYGLLSEYHITPYAREKILKKVALRAHEYVSSMWSGKPSASYVPPDVPGTIQTQVESILSRFRGRYVRQTANKLLPARSLTSLRETAEVRPYLVLCPADVLTMVNALFPEGRPMSSMSSGLQSESGSTFGQPGVIPAVPVPSRPGTTDGSSTISTSLSSVASELSAPWRDSLAGQDGNSSQKTPADIDPHRGANNFEDDAYRLRLALHELRQSCGPDYLRGSCHPCADGWDVIYIAADGSCLGSSIEAASDDTPDDVAAYPVPKPGKDDLADGLQWDHTWRSMRHAVLKLVEDYEVPHSLEYNKKDNSELSSRASKLAKYRAKTQKGETAPAGKTDDNSPKSSFNGDATQADSPAVDSSSQPVLIEMLRAATSQSKAQADYVSAHMYWQTLRQLTVIEPVSLRWNDFATLIRAFAREPLDSMHTATAAVEEYDAWLVWLRLCQERQESSIHRMMESVRFIRDKMWFATDVRNSKEYTNSREICHALKTMGMPRRWRSLQQSRSTNIRTSGSSYLHRTEAQVMDLLASTEEQGGPNKLRDDQVDMTAAWLRQRGIENFCQGEERIHRFCCEVDKCVSKLIGDTIREAPVLWSSELFRREKLTHHRTRVHERTSSLSGDEAASISTEGDRRATHASSRTHPHVRDSRGIPVTPGPYLVEPGRINFTRPTSLSDVVDSPEYWDKSSPVYTNDSFSTFWSPFQGNGISISRNQSPTTSLTNLSTTFSGSLHHGPAPSSSSVSTRPGTSASSNDTVYQQRAEDKKTRFLSGLRKTLVGLLLSDWGTSLLSQGSETDVWFRDLGQQCIERKDAMERRSHRKEEKKDKDGHSRNSTRLRVIEKKKSFSNLRSAGEQAAEPRCETSPAEHAFASAGATSNAARMDAGDFPFKKAYAKLLDIFSVSPNPYEKLRALNELEGLIVASLLWNGPHRIVAARSDSNSSDAVGHGKQRRQTPLDGTIDNVKERRLHTIQSTLPAGHSRQTRQSLGNKQNMPADTGVDTEAITSELQRLFRVSNIRPRALFRDLQLIASFVPAAILDRADMGKAFWNAGLAALRLKSEVCRTMVEMADDIIAAHTRLRKAPADRVLEPDIKPSLTGTPPPPSATYKLDDVGTMWTITAKEGYPTAQRELALFYLSNPEHVARTSLPLSKPRDVFKQAVMEKYGRSEKSRSSSGTSAPINSGAPSTGKVVGLGAGMPVDGQAPGGKSAEVRNDAGLMCVAVHWMEAAEQGGDELASSFLRQNEFMAFG